MKIIRKDNYNREHVADQLVAENIIKYYGEVIVEMLNDKFVDCREGCYSPDYYELVEDDYVLWKGMEELV
ncbi:hypothetical protein EBB07_28745 [Paenibacillaceae bacterium]|nr:hypothetical protein EBB07_28745 [Paenibacillaceae bacterium]